MLSRVWTLSRLIIWIVIKWVCLILKQTKCKTHIHLSQIPWIWPRSSLQIWKSLKSWDRLSIIVAILDRRAFKAHSWWTQGCIWNSTASRAERVQENTPSQRTRVKYPTTCKTCQDHHSFKSLNKSINHQINIRYQQRTYKTVFRIRLLFKRTSSIKQAWIKKDLVIEVSWLQTSSQVLDKTVNRHIKTTVISFPKEWLINSATKKVNTKRLKWSS